MEIEVPKDVRPIMLDGAEETILGDPDGAIRQYRYGNLHIREYKDKYIVHSDTFDPRKDPLLHLIFDAPEVLIGSAVGLYMGFGGRNGIILNREKDRYHKSDGNSIVLSVLLALLSGYTLYRIIKWIKHRVLWV
jgi:hypothetical protein